MKLYYAPHACSMAVHIILREANLNFKIEKVDLQKKQTETGEDYLKINPKGVVPALKLDDGEILTEAAVVMQYVADQVLDKKLIPACGTRERYRLLEWLNYISTELHKGFSPLFKETTPGEYRTVIIERLNKQFDLLTNRLSKNMFLMGDDFTIVDAYLFTILKWSNVLSVDLKPWPVLLKYCEHINARASVQATLQAEKAV